MVMSTAVAAETSAPVGFALAFGEAFAVHFGEAFELFGDRRLLLPFLEATFDLVAAR